MQAIIAAAAIASLAVPATAEGVDQTIEHRDLDLATARGQKLLATRIDKTARAVCGYDDVITGTRVRSREVSRCYVEAKASANESVVAAMNQRIRSG